MSGPRGHFSRRQMASAVAATSNGEFRTVSLLLMALVVALGYGLSMTSLTEDLAILQQLVRLR